MRRAKHPVVALGEADDDGHVPIVHISHSLPAGIRGHDPANYGIPSNKKPDGTDHQINVSNKVTVHHDDMTELSTKHPLHGHVVDHTNLSKLNTEIGVSSFSILDDRDETLKYNCTE